MATNTNFQISLQDVFNFLIATWRKKRGINCILLIEIGLFILGYFKGCIQKDIFFLFLPLLLILTLVIWSIQTKRYFQRYTTFRYYTCIFATATSLLYYFVLHSLYIKGSIYEVWGSQHFISLALFLILLAIGLFTPFLIKSNDLVIVFLVSNESKFEEQIMNTLNETKYKIEKEDSKIHIIIPSFGIANSISECEDYIHSYFNHADALIYARMLDSDSQEFGYCFTDFTSRMGNHFLEKDKPEDDNIQKVLTEEQKVNSWNTLNSKTDNITTKERMSNQLSEMLLLYVSCIYLYKKKYSDAIAVAQKLFDIKASRSSVVTKSTLNVLAHAYLTAELSEETVNHDYEQAYFMLEECANRIPFIKTLACYQLAKARILFFKGDLKASKKITNALHSSRENLWFTSINKAFYAIVEKKPLEMYANYKRLCKIHYLPSYYEVKFAIDFLEYQYISSSDLTYKMYLLHGLAYLYLYTDKQKSQKKIIRLDKEYRNMPDYDRLENIRNLVDESYDKLKMDPKGNK